MTDFSHAAVKHRFKKIYLAGPMSGFADHNFPAFDKATAALRADGIIVISPAELSRQIQVQVDDNGNVLDGTYAICMRQDIEALLTVDAVVVLPGWERSRGARFEAHLAQLLNLPVIDYHTVEIIDAIVMTTIQR